MSRAVAIVGAGPAGCYLAQALLKARPDLAVDLFDALPVPYGLVRYGVAADHQGTKGVIRQFARLFERQGARFVGNVAVGRDLPLEALRASHDAVVLACGLHGDRRLGIPGDDLPGVIGSGALTRALNGHPDAPPLPALGPNPLIVGAGNVALDIARLLASTEGALAGSDLGPEASAWIAGSGIGQITVLARGPAAAARFDPAMLKEIARLEGITLAAEVPADGQDSALLAALRALDGAGAGPRRLRFVFERRPVAIEGEARAEALRVEGPDGPERLACSAAITAIGFECDGLLPRAAQGEPDAEGCLAPGLWAAGWYRTGPRGTLPQARAAAAPLAAAILASLEDAPPKPGRSALPCLPQATDYAAWARIDAAEIAAAAENRCRRKFASREALLAAARAKEEQTP